MLTSSKEDLVGYIKDPTLRWSPIFGAAIAGLGAVLLTSGIKPFDSSVVGTIFSLATFFGGCAVIWEGISSSKKFKAYIQEIESTGELQVLLADFSHSCSMVGDNVRLGEKFIFGKKKERPVGYNEISRVYENIHKTNSVEDGRHLEAVLTNGKTCVLCELKKGGQSDADVSKIMGYIRQQNPNVHLGYK